MLDPEPSGLLFMPQYGAPIKDPAVRKHIRRQVMQQIGRRRRKTGLNRRLPALEFSLEVIDDFEQGASRPLPAVPDLRIDNRGHTHPEGGRSHMVTLPERCSNSSVRALDPTITPFHNLGAGSLDPFAKYPFELDGRARELLHTVLGTNSGMVKPFSVVPFRVIWIEISIMESAAFHQFLAGAQAYLDFLRTEKVEEFSPQVFAHRACALRLINAKVAKVETASSDGVIASLVLLARYYQMIGDFEKWHMHMFGLKEIIRLRGHIDEIDINELLRHMLSNIDISGSFALDAVPVFPIPAKLLPPPRARAPSGTFDPFTSHFTPLWRSMWPEHIQLVALLSDIKIESLLLRQQISQSKALLWTETMYICRYINPLLHRLLCLATIDQSHPTSPVAEGLRLGSAIYLAAIRRAFGILPFQSGAQVQKIKELFDKLDAAENEASDDQCLDESLGWGCVKIWVLACAAINKPPGLDGQWFTDRLHVEMHEMGMETYDQFENYVESFLWIPEVHGWLLRFS